MIYIKYRILSSTVLSNSLWHDLVSECSSVYLVTKSHSFSLLAAQGIPRGRGFLTDFNHTKIKLRLSRIVVDLCKRLSTFVLMWLMPNSKHGSINILALTSASLPQTNLGHPLLITLSLFYMFTKRHARTLSPISSLAHEYSDTEGILWLVLFRCLPKLDTQCVRSRKPKIRP
jgi:hypothetical protein